MSKIVYERMWTMPSKWTFDMRPVVDLLDFYSVGDGWADPFGAKNKIAEYTNNFQDGGPDAFEFMQSFEDHFLAGVLFDPPYSMEQVKRSYGAVGISNWQTRFGNNKNGGFPNVKDEISRTLKPGGIVISFGWNSNGLGKGRGFIIERVVNLAHGGNRHDTIITVERKSHPTENITAKPPIGA